MKRRYSWPLWTLTGLVVLVLALHIDMVVDLCIVLFGNEVRVSVGVRSPRVKIRRVLNLPCFIRTIS